MVSSKEPYEYEFEPPVAIVPKKKNYDTSFSRHHNLQADIARQIQENIITLRSRTLGFFLVELIFRWPRVRKQCFLIRLQHLPVYITEITPKDNN